MLAYVIRHAESLSNIDKAAGLNEGLSELGRRQAKAVAERLGTLAVSAIYSSPFSRCIETAVPAAKALKQPIRIRPELCEHHHLPQGTLADTGLATMDEIARRYPETVPCSDGQEPFDWIPVDESFEQLLIRARSFAGFLKRHWTEEDDIVLVFGHGSPIARMIEAWLIDEPGPSFRFIIDNASIAALRYHREISTLVCLNEVSHLHGLPVPDGSNYRADGSIKTRPSTNYW